MTRYEYHDRNGDLLYRGRSVRPRVRLRTSEIALRVAASTFGLIVGLMLLGVPDALACILGSLLAALWTQMIINGNRRRAERDWRAVHLTSTREAPTGAIMSPRPPHELDAPTEAERAVEARLKEITFSAETNTPYLDYAAGEVWTPEQSRDYLADQARLIETHRVVHDLRRGLGQPERDRAVRRSDVARYSIIDLKDLSVEDRNLIRSTGGARFGPDARVTLPSGLELTGPQLMDVGKRLQRADGPRGRTAEAIRTDLAVLRAHMDQGKVDSTTGASLWNNLWAELRRAEGRS